VGVAKQRPRCFARFRQGILGSEFGTAFGGAHCFFAKKQVRIKCNFGICFVLNTKRILI